MSLVSFSSRHVAIAASHARPTPVLPFAILAAVLSFFALREPLLATWTSGAFVDTDDAMRLVQVRGLLHGQGWFDMTAYGMDPPRGTFMHWSRIVDAPVALLIEGFGLVADPITAERLARLTFPFALLVGLYCAMARLVGLLLGPGARLAAIAATLLSGDGIIQFLPGRIDHHAPQILTLVVMLGAAVAALEPGKARQAAIAGLLAGLSLAISLENLPFIAVLALVLVALWVWHGATMARMLLWYCGGLAIGLPVFFGATVAPSRYLLPVCDAYGAAHLGAGLIGAAGCALAALVARSSGRAARLAMAGAIGGLAAGFVALAYPSCLHDPFAGVDALVHDVWLRNVTESLPLPRALRDDPSTALTATIPVALGLAGCLAAMIWRRGLERRRFILVAAIVATGLAMAFWQVRVLTSVTAIALCGGLSVALSLEASLRRRGRGSVATLSLAMIIPFTATAASLVLSVVLPLVLPATRTGAEAALLGASTDSCLTSEALAPLATLPPGRVLAPVDAGSYLLAQTRLSVFAAAFHRDNDGNRFAFETMLAPPDEAQRMAARRGVGYVMICPGPKETGLLAKRSPDGLAAALLADRIPAWLVPVPLRGTPVRLFRVVSAVAQ